MKQECQTASELLSCRIDMRRSFRCDDRKVDSLHAASVGRHHYCMMCRKQTPALTSFFVVTDHSPQIQPFGEDDPLRLRHLVFRRNVHLLDVVAIRSGMGAGKVAPAHPQDRRASGQHLMLRLFLLRLHHKSIAFHLDLPCSL